MSTELKNKDHQEPSPTLTYLENEPEFNNLYFASLIHATESQVQISLAPNPSSMFLNLISRSRETFITYELSDDAGKILLVKALKVDSDKINMKNYEGEKFVLDVYDDKKLLKSFFIQKIK